MPLVHTLCCVLCAAVIGTHGTYPVRLYRFTPVRDLATGSIACGAGNNATSSSAVESALACCRLCVANVKCAAFTFRESTTQPKCEQFSTTLRSCYSVQPGCYSYQNATTDSAGEYVDTRSVLMQRHFNGTTSFNKSWAQFKVGFGDPSGDYWIGNDRLHELTKGGLYKLRVDLQSKYNGQWYWAEYNTFVVDDESTNYILHVGGYNGTAGDAMAAMSGMKFTTFDVDNDHTSALNCANQYYNVGGFWFNACTDVYINNAAVAANGFSWWWLPTGSTADKVTRGLIESRLTLVCK